MNKTEKYENLQTKTKKDDITQKAENGENFGEEI